MLTPQQFEDLINYEPESGYLDFKAIQYKKDANVSFVKDILSMANSAVPGERYIIIGVKVNADSTRSFLGITEDFRDEAAYQQLIHANIEPEVSISYVPITWDDKLFGIFSIKECADKPYMMKKNLGGTTPDDKGLRQGEMWMRKGSTQQPVMRRDLEQMFADKRPSFEGRISIVPVGLDPGTGKLKIPKKGVLPSDEEAELIRREIANRKAGNAKPSSFVDGKLVINLLSRYSEAELEDQLRLVKTTYASEDCFARFEENSAKLNFRLTNTGEEYLKDVSIIVFVPKSPEIAIAPKIYKNRIGLADFPLDPDKFTKVKNYPQVTDRGDHYELKQYRGDVKHNIPETIFVNELRLSIAEEVAGKALAFTFRVFAENLPRAVELAIMVETMLQDT